MKILMHRCNKCHRPMIARENDCECGGAIEFVGHVELSSGISQKMQTDFMTIWAALFSDPSRLFRTPILLDPLSLDCTWAEDYERKCSPDEWHPPGGVSVDMNQPQIDCAADCKYKFYNPRPKNFCNETCKDFVAPSRSNCVRWDSCVRLKITCGTCPDFTFPKKAEDPDRRVWRYIDGTFAGPDIPPSFAGPHYETPHVAVRDHVYCNRRGK